MPAAWHLTVVPEGTEGVPTVGVTVTFVEAEADGPLHPVAVTETIAVPENPAAHVTVAEVPIPLIVFPEPVTFQL